ncbi:MAG: hypothetical protein R2770_06730 [Acidimicrobiales bacterium]
MGLMITGMILATVGLGLTSVATLKLTGDLPGPIEAALRSDGMQPRRPQTGVADSVALVAGIGVQILGAVVATWPLDEASTMATIAVSWIVAGAGLLSLRSR